MSCHGQCCARLRRAGSREREGHVGLEGPQRPPQTGRDSVLGPFAPGSRGSWDPQPHPTRRVGSSSQPAKGPSTRPAGVRALTMVHLAWAPGLPIQPRTITASQPQAQRPPGAEEAQKQMGGRCRVSSLGWGRQPRGEGEQTGSPAASSGPFQPLAPSRWADCPTTATTATQGRRCGGWDGWRCRWAPHRGGRSWGAGLCPFQPLEQLAEPPRASVFSPVKWVATAGTGLATVNKADTDPVPWQSSGPRAGRGSVGAEAATQQLPQGGGQGGGRGART